MQLPSTFAGIDTSESIITTHKLDIDYLKVNVEKLNKVLKAAQEERPSQTSYCLLPSIEMVISQVESITLTVVTQTLSQSSISTDKQNDPRQMEQIRIYTDSLLYNSSIKDIDSSYLLCKSNINFYWNILQNIIITAGNTIIPSKQLSAHKQKEEVNNLSTKRGGGDSSLNIGDLDNPFNEITGRNKQKRKNESEFNQEKPQKAYRSEVRKIKNLLDDL
ncbi:4539_t:CDS:2, partial [Funneliformis geosporum]